MLMTSPSTAFWMHHIPSLLPSSCSLASPWAQAAEEGCQHLQEQLRALEEEVGRGLQLLEQATAEGKSGEVALADARSEVTRLEQALQVMQAESRLSAANGHTLERPAEEVALQMDEVVGSRKEAEDRKLEAEQLRSEISALKDRLAASNRRASSSGQEQVGLMLLIFHRSWSTLN